MGEGTTPHSNPSYESADGGTPPLKQSASKLMATAATFKFRKAEFTSQGDDWAFEPIGVLNKIKDFADKRVTFTKRNLKSDKRVTLQLFPAKYDELSKAIEQDDVYLLPCTSNLSKVIRKALAQKADLVKVIGWLCTLEVQQDDQDRYFLFNEKGDGEALPSFLVKSLKPVALSEILEEAF